MPSSSPTPAACRFRTIWHSGLEFLIAASAIKTLNDHSLQQVAVLGGMVLCRTMVGLYPRWEVRADLARTNAAPASVDPAAAASAVADRPAAIRLGESPALAASAAQSDSTASAAAESIVANPPIVTMAS